MYNVRTLEIPDYMILLRAIRICGDTELAMKEYAELLHIDESYMVQLKNALLKNQWITVKKVNKYKYMRLTSAGEDIADCVINLLKSMNINDDNISQYRVLKKTKSTGEKTNEDSGEIC